MMIEYGITAGRDISKTSQEMQHFTAAGLYKIFGINMTLYDFIKENEIIVRSCITVDIWCAYFDCNEKLIHPMRKSKRDHDSTAILRLSDFMPLKNKYIPIIP